MGNRMIDNVVRVLGPWRDLKINLGVVNAQLDLLTLAWRALSKSAGTDASERASYVRMLSEAHGIHSLSEIRELPDVEGRLTDYAVVMCFEQFEKCLVDLWDSAKDVGFSVPFERDAKLSDKLRRIADGSTPSGLTGCAWTLRLKVLDYYRAIRDRTVHGHLSQTLQTEIEGHYGKWKELMRQCDPIRHVVFVPSVPGECARDDVSYCSMVTKEVAYFAGSTLFQKHDIEAYGENLRKEFGRFDTKEVRRRNAIISPLPQK